MFGVNFLVAKGVELECDQGEKVAQVRDEAPCSPQCQLESISKEESRGET